MKDDVTITILQHDLKVPGAAYAKFAGKHKHSPFFEAAAVAAAANGSNRRRLKAAPEEEIDKEKRMEVALVMETEDPQWCGKD